jgi:glycosyltransferase involved in cell wall biosynthesis
MKNVHVTLTPFLNESRVLKEVNSLLESGISTQVIIIAIWRAGLKKSEKIDDRIRIIRVNPYMLYVIKKLTNINEISFYKLLIAFLSVRIFFIKPDIINIHHVNALGIVRLNRVLKKCLFIYDTHELETETQSSTGELKVFRQNLERKFIPIVDYIFVVTPSIEHWYRNAYNIDKITTVMNIPIKHSNVINKNIFRKKYGLDNQDTIFIYNGSLFEGRGIEILLEVFEKIGDKTNHIIFMGDGQLENLILDYEERNKNIHFHQAVEPSKVIDYTSSADVGISLIENVCLSYYYCLPNKIFEYTISEIPLIVSNMLDMSNYVLENNIGIVAKNNSLYEVTKCIEILSRDKTLYKDALLRTKEKYNWGNEEDKMIRVYKNLLSQ